MKTVISLVLALLVGGVVFFIQQQRLDRQSAANQELLAKQQQLETERDEAQAAADAASKKLLASQQDQVETLRLRKQVEQLRQERDAAKQEAAQLAAAAAAAPASPPAASPATGRYISKDQLSFVGYATPEAGLQSTTWAMLKGTYEQAMAGLNPEMQQKEASDPKEREQFEARRQTMAPLFKGMQLISRKTLPDGRVELKVKMDADPLPNQTTPLPDCMIQPMSKIGNEWKLGGSTRGYTDAWEKDGVIEPAN
jgi:hypothetical protein